MKKSFVLDTSVLIHDPNSMFAFRGNDVIIPIYCVMELDVLKTSKDLSLAQTARQVIRNLSSLETSDVVSNSNLRTGVYIQDYDVTIIVSSDWSEEVHEAYQHAASQSYMDGLILKCAIRLSDTNNVVLVTKDSNLRIMGASAGLKVQDYAKDKVDSDSLKSAELYDIIDIPEEIMNGNVLYQAFSGNGVPIEELFNDKIIIYNNQYIRIIGNKTYLLKYVDGFVRGVNKTQIGDVQPRDHRQAAFIDLLLDNSVELVMVQGKAGTGKTFLALAAALEMVIGKHKQYNKIVLAKPVIPMGRELGFLPGSFDEKIHPWMESYLDNLDQLFPADSATNNKSNSGKKKDTKVWEYLFDNQIIEMQALHTIRGRSLSKSIIMIDECQNLTPHEVLTIVTRAGEGSKVIMMGDIDQIDNQYVDRFSNGLSFAIDRTKTSNITGYVILKTGTRSPLADMASELLRA